ncbi:PAS domain S-box-containing protein/diguanylate cyclase (GGDEF)-like protein [Halopolyspora algeriensis]|uniref:PAS domain S-box-containing protein/diguanylate cyclase (GGDEF)-like protein n=1 Tax=Halopolyspora algeriensis TaxID=1500506 RepID=A0A368VY89_9ACTN|nr:EAL domain-containing protein [Halopolyspora algeriensis]RCW47168.1 PAS domain S-box-containing protein/diguanylate cyclase (GGDEF)-like protein [Halopolyspora algeriensis]TQM48254.1 PAS domain S-box-containing protein/diguanylate cyclase (GGDEF)-like protein [Halopolyspora algeriensis]
MSGRSENVDVGKRAETEGDLELLAGILHEYAVITLDPKGKVTSWNPGAEHIKGYSAEEIIGQHFSVFYTPEQAAAGRPDRVLAMAAEAGSHIDEEWRVRKDGTRFWAHVVITSLRTSSGKLRGFAKVTRDDTEHRARLERLSRRFTDLFDLAPVGIGLLDTSDRVVEANPALCSLLGYSQHELQGMAATELLHPDDPGGALTPEAPEPGTPTGIPSLPQRMLVHSDGRVVHCELHITRSVRDSESDFWLVVFQDVTERQQQAEELHYRATHDELTGLPNRAAVGDLLGGADLESAAVLYCDIDNFKRINDSLGHAAGDELILAVARRLEAGLPDRWSLARPAGDEYLIICPDVSAAGGIDAVVTTVSSLLRMTVPLRGKSIRVSASIGVAVADDSVADGEDLVRFASAAVLEAKREPERISQAGPTLITSLDRQLQMEEQLRVAIESDELTLHYQPIVIADGTIVGAEALVRWSHPERGLLGPDVFLPVAERGGLLRDLDCWVLHTALCEAAEWPTSAGQPVGIGVNLTALVPGAPDFGQAVADFLTGSDVAWQRVVLELVETSLIDLPSRSMQAMNDLVEQGVRFAVDDFGTGYSSLIRLKELPVRIIKIDRQFTSGIETDPSDFAMVRAINDMARAMGYDCIAEGVATAGQLDLLRGIGVESHQGWLFSPAVPAPEFRALIEGGPLQPVEPD